ncbi:hypothetical protein NKG94_29125 [Micromonospora sp. M12]
MSTGWPTSCPARRAMSVRCPPRSTPSWCDRPPTRSPRGAGLRWSARRRLLRRPGAIFDLGTLRPFQQLHVAGKKIFKAEGSRSTPPTG